MAENDIARRIAERLFPNEPGTIISMNEAEIRAELEPLLAEIAALRETNTALNRRAQSAESGLTKALDARYTAGERNFGRALANSAATMYAARLASLEAAVDAVLEDADTMDENTEEEPCSNVVKYKLRALRAARRGATP